ncbi:MAG TPA: tetratricopeptide repeat protein, partial [Longimicrobiales bacterium]|nr:tetratricopeptide repeat protein [Longimicrobiales bacterium]
AEAIAAYGRASTACQRLGDRRGLAQAHQNLAINFRETGLPREAHAHFREAMAHARATDSQDILAGAAVERAVLLLMTGDPAMARATARRALKRFEAIGDAAGRGDSLRVLGHVELATGHLDEARSHLEDALDLARSASDALLEAETLATLAAVYRRTGETDLADQTTQAAEAIFHRLGATAWGARLHERLAAPVAAG